MRKRSGAEICGDITIKKRGDREIEYPAAWNGVGLVKLGEAFFYRDIKLRIVITARNKMKEREELGYQGGGGPIPFDRHLYDSSIVFVGEFFSSAAKKIKLVGKQTPHKKLEKTVDYFPAGQVSGGSKNNKSARFARYLGTYYLLLVNRRINFRHN
jgi:hypothetical protein